MQGVGAGTQQLYLVGVTGELDELIFSVRKGSKSGAYRVKIGPDTVSKLEEVLRLINAGPESPEYAESKPSRQSPAVVDSRRVRPSSKLTPREIQARLRAGRTVEEVAEEAGTDIAWVERFAFPIWAEQAQIVEKAKTLSLATQRKGMSVKPLEASVRWNLADRGLVLPEQGGEAVWDAYHLQESTWVVTFSYRSKSRSHIAEWEFDVRLKELTARNRLASDLGHVAKNQKRKQVAEELESGARSHLK